MKNTMVAALLGLHCQVLGEAGVVRSSLHPGKDEDTMMKVARLAAKRKLEIGTSFTAFPSTSIIAKPNT